MQSSFPEETITHIQNEIKRFYINNKKIKPLRILANVISYYSNEDGMYNFRENLNSGDYALYLHEMLDKKIYGYNCTTIIPNIYILAELLGYHPQIVQFKGFRDITTKNDTEDPVDPSVHFSLIIDCDKDNPYLVDPFYHTFGPILARGENSIRVGNVKGFKAHRREFHEMQEYSAQDFAAMMQRLHDPGASLEMLVSGQKVHSGKPYQSVDCDQHIYFKEETNAIISRLYIPQQLITDKAIIATHKLDTNGTILETIIALYLAKKCTWTTLVDGKRVASASLQTMRKLRKALKKIYDPKKNQRLGPILLHASSQDLDILTAALSDPISYEMLKPQILARTLYETTEPKKHYLYTAEQHDKYLFDVRKQEITLHEQLRKIREVQFELGWKWKKLPRNERRRLNYTKKGIIEKINKAVEQLNFLNYLRYQNKSVYALHMDKVLYAKTLEGQTADDLEAHVLARSVDPNIGYLATIADFLPILFEAEDELLLKQFMPKIQEKVAARNGHPLLRNTTPPENNLPLTPSI